MPAFIIKIKDRYFEWSSIVDAPISEGMTLSNFKRYYKIKYGEEKFKHLSERLARVEKTGTSEVGSTLASTISVNRAGKNETCLTKDEIYGLFKQMEGK